MADHPSVGKVADSPHAKDDVEGRRAAWGELFTLDADGDGSRFSFTMPDGRVAVYRTFIDDDEDVEDRHILIFVGIDSFA